MENISSRRDSSPEEVSDRRPKRCGRLRDVGGGVDDVASDEESEEGVISPKRCTNYDWTVNTSQLAC